MVRYYTRRKVFGHTDRRALADLDVAAPEERRLSGLGDV